MSVSTLLSHVIGLKEEDRGMSAIMCVCADSSLDTVAPEHLNMCKSQSNTDNTQMIKETTWLHLHSLGHVHESDKKLTHLLDLLHSERHYSHTY